MNIILLSGGSGRRLWPLSNDVRSKQFIKIFKNEDGNGNYESMVQRVYRQIRKADPDASVTIATSRSQVSAIHGQPGSGVKISVNSADVIRFRRLPWRWCTWYISRGSPRKKQLSCVRLPRTLKTTILRRWEGVKPQHVGGQGGGRPCAHGDKFFLPERKYGYVIPALQDSVSGVSTFKEKLDLDTAKTYITQGALWNGGVFTYKSKYVLNRACE